MSTPVETRVAFLAAMDELTEVLHELEAALELVRKRADALTGEDATAGRAFADTLTVPMQQFPKLRHMVENIRAGLAGLWGPGERPSTLVS